MVTPSPPPPFQPPASGLREEAGGPHRGGRAPVILGVLGWACVGPLAATLLVGRTALLLPSIRWLLAAALAWAVAGAVAWLTRTTRLPGGGGPGRSRSIGHAVASALPSLALLAAAAPLLPLLYLDDRAYHQVAGGAAPARALAGYLGLLLLAGSLVRRFLDGVYVAPAPGPPPAPAPTGAGGGPGAPGVIAPLLSMALMLGANYGVFFPL